MRLIDADALKETMIEVLERIKSNPKMDKEEMHIIAGMSMLGEMIDDSPTVEPEKICVANLTLNDEQIEEAVKDALNEYVLEEPTSQWIPVSERLPEEGQEILATTTDNAWGDVVIIRTFYKEMHKSIIAWMPLPEPYNE